MTIDVKNLRSSYGSSTVLDKISFSVQSSEPLFIIGPNGSGKSTLLSCLVGLQPYEGDIQISKQSIKHLSRKELAQKVGLLSQTNSTAAQFDVFDTILMGRYSHRTDPLIDYSREDSKLVDDLLEKCGLTALKYRKLSELSGGEVQRAMIARLMAQDPEVILLDEMTTHLDSKYQREMVELILKWQKEKNRVLITVVHDLNLVLQYAKRVLLLTKELDYYYGSTEELLSQRRLDEVYGFNVVESYFQSVSRWYKLGGYDKMSQRGDME